MEIPTLVEAPRGCGYRSPGGLYLMSDAIGMPCDRLPVELTVCPVCKAGVKQARGWTWVDGRQLIAGEVHGDEPHRASCPLEPDEQGVDPRHSRLGETTGLLWVGERYYSPASFAREAAIMGVSKRIAAVPRGLELGRTWVLLAHPKAVGHVGSQHELEPDDDGDVACARCGTESPAPGAPCVYDTPGVFHVFRPSRLEYVVKGDETDEELESLVKRGIRPVRVEKAGEDRPFDELEEEAAK